MNAGSKVFYNRLNNNFSSVNRRLTPWYTLVGVCGWQKWLWFGFRFGFAKKLRFLVRFRFYKINHGFSYSVRLGLLSSVDVDAIFHSCLDGMTLEMTYFRAELVQLIVSRSDSELEMQRYGTKKNNLTVDELWIRQREKPFPNHRTWFLKIEPRKPSFRFLNFEVGWARFGFSKTDIRHFRRVPHTPTLLYTQLYTQPSSTGTTLVWAHTALIQWNLGSVVVIPVGMPLTSNFGVEYSAE